MLFRSDTSARPQSPSGSLEEHGSPSSELGVSGEADGYFTPRGGTPTDVESHMDNHTLDEDDDILDDEEEGPLLGNSGSGNALLIVRGEEDALELATSRRRGDAGGDDGDDDEDDVLGEQDFQAPVEVQVVHRNDKT